MDNDNLFGSEDDEIDVEESMKKIRDNLLKKKKKTMEPSYSDPTKTGPVSSRTAQISGMTPDDARDMACLSGNWDIQNASYTIRSHRPIIGPLLVRGRELVHGEVRRYIDPVLWRQTEFNRAASNQISHLNHRVQIIERHSQQNIDKSKEIRSRLPVPSFSDYGETSEPDIRQRLGGFLPYFEDAKNVVVIGSGQGCILAMMREEGIIARGTDDDTACVELCRSRGFEAECNEAIPYLEQVKDASLDGIFIDLKRTQLPPEMATRLVTLSHRKIKSGKYCIVDSINPPSYIFFTRLYGMGNGTPIHPDAMKILLESVGFSEVRVKFSDPAPGAKGLQRLPFREVADEETRKETEILNRNIDLLNEVIYGPLFYTILGRG